MSWKTYLGIGVILASNVLSYKAGSNMVYPLAPRDLNNDGITDVIFRKGILRTPEIYLQQTNGELISLNEIERMQEIELKERQREERDRFKASRRRTAEKIVEELTLQTKNTKPTRK